jgi:hypothetical protein
MGRPLDHHRPHRPDCRGRGPRHRRQVFLVWVIIGHVMPFFGLELLDMTRRVADFNLPARLG